MAEAIEDSKKRSEPPEKDWHIQREDEILSELGSSREGISDAEAGKRIEKYGFNTLARDDKLGFIKILARNFNSLLIYVLLASALISLFTDHAIEFYAIVIIIMFTGFLGFVQEYKAGKSVEALSKLTAKKVNVIRQGKQKEIEAVQLVPGDIVVLRRGMVVPSDIRILESNGLMADESILTGESVSKAKYAKRLDAPNLILSDKNNMLFSGTNITSGSGLGIVVDTGLATELGKISATIKEIGFVKSPLQKRMHGMSKRISTIVICICGLFFIMLTLQGVDMAEALLLTSVLAVSGIPESFPLALTVGLSNGVKKMARQKANIKDLGSVETLGTTTVICTDKTGTLTENKMRVVKLYLASGLELDSKGVGYEPESEFFLKGKALDKKELSSYSDIFNCCTLCNNAELLFDSGEWWLSGEPTEGALLALAKSAGIDDKLVREDNRRIYEVAFDPEKKYMITVNESISNGHLQAAYLKGSIEKVLDMCSFVRINGKLKKLGADDKKAILAKQEAYGSQSLRVLGMATKALKDKIKPDDSKRISGAESKWLVEGYVFEGMVGIEDPIKSDVFEAVKECHSAGIKVMMVTGDHKKTAMSIGERLGLIMSKDDLVLEGIDLDGMEDEHLDRIIRNVAIFSRTTPDHKFRIVKSLQRIGEVVAMTGDGVNDAPALKQADIGVSMGKSGTDVAREASNMVLADDNFSTIVKAVREGRTIYSNIRRFVYYLLVGNFTEVSVIFVSVLAGLLLPLTALMILFVNIVTSTFPASALSIEPTKERVMKQRPRDPKERLLSSYILLKILVLVPILFTGTLLLFMWELEVNGSSIEHARTIAFVTIIMFELFHVFNSRSLHSTIFKNEFFSNKWIFIAIGVSFLATLIAIYAEPAQAVFQTVALSGMDWVIIAIVSSSVIAINEVIKMLIKSEIGEQNKLRGHSYQSPSMKPSIV
jgi:P-type Ca2+ transporter type 2C